MSKTFNHFCGIFFIFMSQIQLSVLTYILHYSCTSTMVLAHLIKKQKQIYFYSAADLPYVFKIHTGSSNSCWPARSVYFLAAGFAEKHQWVEKIEAVTSQRNGAKNISTNAVSNFHRNIAMLEVEKLLFCSMLVGSHF